MRLGMTWTRVGAVLGFLAVAMGAFGAHSLKDRLDELGTSATFQTATEYHMYHALALLGLGLLAASRPARQALCIAGWSFLLGTVVFSGSLYAYALTGERSLGKITPFGGVALLVGWVALAVAAGTLKAADPVSDKGS